MKYVRNDNITPFSSIDFTRALTIIPGTRRSIDIPLRSLFCIKCTKEVDQSKGDVRAIKETPKDTVMNKKEAYHTFGHCIWVRTQVNQFTIFINAPNHYLQMLPNFYFTAMAFCNHLNKRKAKNTMKWAWLNRARQDESRIIHNSRVMFTITRDIFRQETRERRQTKMKNVTMVFNAFHICSKNLKIQCTKTKSFSS